MVVEGGYAWVSDRNPKDGLRFMAVEVVESEDP